jgi:hypothetical protein
MEKSLFFEIQGKAFGHFKIFKAFANFFTSRKLKTICNMDGGGEYKSNELKNCCDNNGIPQQNDVTK